MMMKTRTMMMAARDDREDDPSSFSWSSSSPSSLFLSASVACSAASSVAFGERKSLPERPDKESKRQRERRERRKSEGRERQTRGGQAAILGVFVSRSASWTVLSGLPELFVIVASTVLLLATLGNNGVAGFPQGAPTEVCDTLLPRHVGTQASGQSSPFYLAASSARYGGQFGYSQAEGIKVELGGSAFKGFFIVAIDPKTGQRIGTWAQVKGTNVLPCSGITHTNNKSKKYASLLWLPPSNEQGYVTFIATVVQSFSQYYMNLVATSAQEPSSSSSSSSSAPSASSVSSSFPSSSFHHRFSAAAFGQL